MPCSVARSSRAHLRWWRARGEVVVPRPVTVASPVVRPEVLLILSLGWGRTAVRRRPGRGELDGGERAVESARGDDVLEQAAVLERLYGEWTLFS